MASLNPVEIMCVSPVSRPIMAFTTAIVRHVDNISWTSADSLKCVCESQNESVLPLTEPPATLVSRGFLLMQGNHIFPDVEMVNL